MYRVSRYISIAIGKLCRKGSSTQRDPEGALAPKGPQRGPEGVQTPKGPRSQRGLEGAHEGAPKGPLRGPAAAGPQPLLRGFSNFRPNANFAVAGQIFYFSRPIVQPGLTSSHRRRGLYYVGNPGGGP